MQCQRCGSQVGGAAFCSTCGAKVEGSQFQTQPQPQYSAPPPPPSGGGNKVGLVVVGLLVGVLIVGAVAAAFFLGRSSGDDDQDAREQSSDTQTSEPTEGAGDKDAGDKEDNDAGEDEETEAPPAQSSGPGDVRDLPAGLFCRDLKKDSYSYSAAVDYWRMHGQPDQMDADGNGIPCETVYPADRVADYWGDRMPSANAPTYEPPSGDSYLDLPQGLFCKDLYSGGYSYGDALSYWYFWGMPDRMDADRNGIPCETVYPKSTVDLYW